MTTQEAVAGRTPVGEAARLGPGAAVRARPPGSTSPPPSSCSAGCSSTPSTSSV
ncbi:hypothetical protein ACFQ51_16660 [Streptomyces kaempferi]